MIKSKGIRILCYIAMGIVYLVSIIMLIYGLSSLAEEDSRSLGVLLIVLSIIIPIITSISMYPVFALSLIETNTSKINDNLETIIDLLEKNPTPTIPQQTATPHQNYPPMDLTNPLKDALNFINQRYNIQIDISDDLHIIKEKILEINEINSSTQIFKKRIIDADSKDGVWNIIKMHHVAYKK